MPGFVVISPAEVFQGAQLWASSFLPSSCQGTLVRYLKHPVANLTILHLMGFDHPHLTYRFGGRDYRLTDVFGKVVGELLTLSRRGDEAVLIE